jgi:hypothetical protein
MKCPCCNGIGKINKSTIIDKPKRREMARKMRKLGFTLEAIMRALDYKSPRSVVLACSRKD